VPVPLRYQSLDFMRDLARGASVAEDNQAHLVSTMSQDSLLVELRNYLDTNELSEGPDFEARFINRLTDMNWIRSLLDRILSPNFDLLHLAPQLKAHEESYFNVLEIFWHSKLNMFLSIVNAERAEAFSAPDPNFNVMGFTTYLCFLEGGPATVKVFDVGNGKLTVEDRVVGPGDVIPVRGAQNSMKFMSCKKDLAVLAINSLSTRTHDVLRYSVADGKMIRRSTNDVEAQRFFLYSTVLRLMERTDATEAFAKLLQHDEPTLRWHVMRELLALDALAARPHLEHMAISDPDPVVRKTASDTLERHRAVLFP